jgi:23S rRNA U2552 (ribose-2'-O)-methylase RlmE/FtsJ
MDNRIHWLEPVALSATSPIQEIRVSSGTSRPAFLTPQHEALIAIKNEIDTVAPVSTWDDAKKITNPYEYIFLSLQRRMYRSVAAVQPLSRSYFKMIELWDSLDLYPPVDRPLLTSHSAEGPGGFLEAIQHRAPGARSIAMTLRSTERSVPGWRKSQQFLISHPTVCVTYGADATGNLYHLPNQTAFALAAYDHLGPPGADLYTADGGFDFSTDYNGQENTVQRLLAAEALAGLQSLHSGGIMILKVFDTHQLATNELLWTLANCFERTGLVKPFTSRPANSERYWIGYGFRQPPAWVLALLNILTATDAPSGWEQIYAIPPWTPDWLAGVRQFQEAIEAQQYANIQLTLNVIRSPSRAQILSLLHQNIALSRAWCLRHRIPENRQYVGRTDAQVAALNLEEALAPFPVAAVRTSSPTSSQRRLMPDGLSAALLPRPPVGPAWRSTLPASIRDPGAFRTASDTPLSSPSSPPESHLLTDPPAGPPEPPQSSDEPRRIGAPPGLTHPSQRAPLEFPDAQPASE